MKIKITFKNNEVKELDCKGIEDGFRQEPYTDPNDYNYDDKGNVVSVNAVYRCKKVNTLIVNSIDKIDLGMGGRWVKDNKVIFDKSDIVSVEVTDLNESF